VSNSAEIFPVYSSINCGEIKENKVCGAAVLMGTNKNLSRAFLVELKKNKQTTWKSQV
jgi:hypothetical protein